MSLSAYLDTLTTLQSDAVLITVLQTKGSVPRETGTKMVVTAQGIQGTIGGGHLEHKCIASAQQRLSDESAEDWLREIKHFPLGSRLGQCCGGVVIVMLEFIPQTKPDTDTWFKQLQKAEQRQENTLLVTPLNKTQDKFLLRADEYNLAVFPEAVRDDCQALYTTLLNDPSSTSCLLHPLSESREHDNYLFEKHAPSGFHIMLFGAGHVGKALINTLADIECNITWVDSREDQFPETLPPNTTRLVSDHPEDEVRDAPANTCYLIMTHDHQLDQRVCEAVLERESVYFCGLIGSNTKKVKFEHRLRAKGMTEERIAKLTCPIGVPGITGKEPAVIAIAVAAQLLTLR
ncbi:xanthine dehydrogenase accessory protein XdhC [Leucothrix sargassi]|nr:xanthine dehydrogenase accessory protein XdhC [Leucothrix sargassi]